MTERTQEVRNSGAPFTRRASMFRFPVCRVSRLNQTLVVKISDTSLTW
jgi:hypothetical protein